MQSRSWISFALALGLVPAALAQTISKPTHKTIPWQEYCRGEERYCFKYPPSWSMLGEIYDGNGVAVAPPQKEDRAVWDAVIVALVIPPPKGAERPVTVDQAIERAVSSVRESGQNFETLQRQRRTVDDKPAELVKLRYIEKSSGREWIEELVFVEGPESEIYSVALKCAPASLVRMEPLFTRIVDSWNLPETELPPTGGEKPSPQSTRSPAAAPSGSAPPSSDPPEP